MNIENKLKQASEDISAVQNWVDKIYQENFGKYFIEERKLYTKLNSSFTPISDTELEWLLTTLPLELFSVSEALSQFKVSYEVLKLHAKELEAELTQASSESSLTRKKEEAANLVLEDKLVATIFSTIIARVENEISFSREMIMSAKKIWDSRRRTEESNPVKEMSAGSDLPEYRP